jgi:hypothetical protein
MELQWPGPDHDTIRSGFPIVMAALGGATHDLPCRGNPQTPEHEPWLNRVIAA